MAQAHMTPDWIAVDCGVTHLRATAMRADGPIANATREGITDPSADGFEHALLRLIEPWLTAPLTQVIACGIPVAPYRPVPCTPVDASTLIALPTRDNRISLHLAPGLSQANPADLMQGEAVQIAGALALNPDFDGVICLPGTYTKWAHISAGEVVSFQTFMTGEMFALLSRQSVLRHGIAVDGFDDGAFDAAVSDALSRPERLAARLFSLRAEAALVNLSPITARSRLSGLLIGMELAAAKPYWLGQAVILIGAPALCAHYARALAQQGITAPVLDGARCTLAGLSKLRGAL